jgi:hypothetical protein
MATIITVIAGGATAVESAGGDPVIDCQRPLRFECRGGLTLFGDLENSALSKLARNVP